VLTSILTQNSLPGFLNAGTTLSGGYFPGIQAVNNVHFAGEGRRGGSFHYLRNKAVH